MNIRKDFPILTKDLLYFDNAATTQKPNLVIDGFRDYYCKFNAPLYRGVYNLSEVATQIYESCRSEVAQFINCDPNQLIFVQSATAGINYVCLGWAKNILQDDDEIILTEIEHHANIVPWLELQKSIKFKINYIRIKDDFTLDLEHYESLLNHKTKLVSFVHISNVTGIKNNVEHIIKLAKNFKALVLLDACQSAPYKLVDTNKLNADFIVFSGHKMLGPAGIGCLFVRQNNILKPILYGGSMVHTVSYSNVKYLDAPRVYEAGTQAAELAVGLKNGINYLNTISNFDKIYQKLCDFVIDLEKFLSGFERVRILGLQERTILSFSVLGIHAHDVAEFLGRFGICVRAGNHCAQPFHDKLGISGSVRVSFYIYNEQWELDIFKSAFIELMNFWDKNCFL